MKETQKINLITLVSKKVSYVDGFWLLNNNLSSEKKIRDFIKAQGIPILEKDITDILSELSYNNESADIDNLFTTNIKNKAKEGKSEYFSSLDSLYPKNKFREIMNYYLFSPDSYSCILVGYGQTGKTTFVNLISKIIGEEYFGRANVNLLKNSHGLAVLEGKKLFEIAEGQDLDIDTANMLKSIITNDSVYINPKFQLPRTIKPHAKMIMTCNSVPRFKVTDDGIIRRFFTVEMNNKIEKQNKNFIDTLEKDIPFIIYEAMQHPFNIKDFAAEQYSFFQNDPQYGFGFGKKNNDYEGITEYEKYTNMCKALGFKARNKLNFDKFIELEKLYKEKVCDTISKELAVPSGLTLLQDYEEDDLPF